MYSPAHFYILSRALSVCLNFYKCSKQILLFVSVILNFYFKQKPHSSISSTRTQGSRARSFCACNFLCVHFFLCYMLKRNEHFLVFAHVWWHTRFIACLSFVCQLNKPYNRIRSTYV